MQTNTSEMIDNRNVRRCRPERTDVDRRLILKIACNALVFRDTPLANKLIAIELDITPAATIQHRRADIVGLRQFVECVAQDV